uniref:CN hydrolase domain-containing protein n=1 Tax=Bionectria ochroleuca TaxID=29856 RepID=A0A8H7N4B7_BIOOC
MRSHTVLLCAQNVLPAVLKKPLKLACIQLASGADKAANLKHAADQVAKAASGGSKLVVLPECFNSPYGTDYFPHRIASDNKVYLVGGSIPEFNPSTKKYHNTSLIFGPDGRLLATHRKVHLFDIDIPGKISFHESDVLSPGNQITLVDLPEYGSIAVAICYDVRFPELATIAARKGAFALVYPGAFNLTTGPLHWKLLAQARAVDNQIYVAMCSPARDLDASYHAYGHTLVVDPMAQVLDEAEAEEAIIQVELVDEKLAETRRNIALNTQRRFDVYPDVSKGKIQFEDPDLETPK